MNKRLLYLPIIVVLVFGLVRTAALASAPPPAPDSPEIPNASISGVVTYEMGNPIPGVTIQVSTGITVTTDVYGSYNVPDLPDGTYTLTPVFGSYIFTPPSRTVSVPPDAANQNFISYSPKVYLPLILSGFGTAPVACPDFYDDFSNPASGWFIGEDQDIRSEYLNGEYRVLVKPVDMLYWFREPTCDRQNYSVELDARWGGTSGGAYGLFFGMDNDSENYYVFVLDSDYQEFTLARRSSEGWVDIVPWMVFPGINVGNATNHLKATRNGSAITLEINGAALGTWNDGNITGKTYAGVVVNTYTDLPNADARFDNFKVTSLNGYSLVTGQATSSELAGSGLDGKAPLSRAAEALFARFSRVKPIR